MRVEKDVEDTEPPIRQPGISPTPLNDSNSVVITINLRNTPMVEIEKVAEFLYRWVGKSPVFPPSTPLAPPTTGPTFVEIPFKTIKRCYTRLQQQPQPQIGSSPINEFERRVDKLICLLQPAIDNHRIYLSGLDNLPPVRSVAYLARTTVLGLMSMFDGWWGVETPESADDYLNLYSAYHEIPESELEWGTTPMGTRGISRKPKEG